MDFELDEILPVCHPSIEQCAISRAHDLAHSETDWLLVGAGAATPGLPPPWGARYHCMGAAGRTLRLSAVSNHPPAIARYKFT